jgi:hypothetical protein
LYRRLGGPQSWSGCRVPERIEVNMFDMETAIRQMKNNKSPGYDELTTDMITAAGPIGTQCLH